MLYYQSYGNPQGQLVLFIHGGFTTSESFQKQYELLKDYHCVFVDLPMHGRSRRDKNYHFSFENAADERTALINKLSPQEKVIIISHSYGGLTAKILLAKIPDRIEKAVIGSTNIYKTAFFWLYTRKAGCLVLWILNRKRYKKDHISWRLVCDTQKSAWKNFSLDGMEYFKGKCLLLYAQYDSRIIRQSMYLWRKYLPDCRLYKMKKVGHNYFYDAPEQVNELIKSFIGQKGGADNGISEQFSVFR